MVDFIRICNNSLHIERPEGELILTKLNPVIVEYFAGETLFVNHCQVTLGGLPFDTSSFVSQLSIHDVFQVRIEYIVVSLILADVDI